MPPRRSTARSSRASSADAPATADTESPTTPPRRTTRGRRATAKAASTAAATTATESPDDTPVDSPAKTPSKTTKSTSRSRASKAKTVEREETMERVHTLPTRTNPRLSEVKSRQVKLQIIRREDKEIIIGRIKLPTVNGAEHGFLLKRFDTNAIAGSSMFRLAFPYADAEEESAEMAYLESRFDTDVANGGLLPAPRSRSRKATTDSPSTKKGGVLPPGSTGVRLQGVWIPCEHAAAIASDYGLLEFAQPLIEATALLLPNDTVPLLNPSENLIKTAEEVRARVWEKKDTDSATSTPARQSKRARTGTSAAQDSPAAAAAAVSMPEGEQEAEPATETPSKRRTTRRQTRTSAATSAAATIAEATRAADAMVSPEPLTPSQVDKQIEEAKALAAKIRAESNTESDATGASRHSKRRVEEVDSDDVVVAPQETRVSAPTPQIPHRHPLARGMLTAAGAVGLGAVAWYSGGNVNLSSAVPQVLQQLQRVDYASALNTIQNNIQNWGVSSWFG